ncbi:MAG: T9SS type A sorting domain-containing protein [Ignavibacteria bacterium]|nr:T9SS type A sorting domain-containing protein [Ignavibacteria bacterium]
MHSLMCTYTKRLRFLLFIIALVIFTIGLNAQDKLNSIGFTSQLEGAFVGDNGLIYNTTDSGLNWSLIPAFTSNKLNNIAVHGNIMVAVGDSGTIARSTNSGRTWALIPTGASFNFKSVSINDSGTGFIVGNSLTLYKTTDHGQSWEGITGLLPTGNAVDLTSISMYGTNRGIIAGMNRKFFLTSDGGETWNLPTSMLYYALNYTSIKMTDSLTAYAASIEGKLVRTTDGGLTWIVVYIDNTGISYNNIINVRAGKYAVAGNGGTVRLSDGNIFVWQLQESSTTRNLNCMAYIDTITGFAGGDNGILLKTNDKGATWSEVEYLQLTGTGTNTSVPVTARLLANYPNPFNPTTNISYSVPFDANVTIKVYDIKGREISSPVNGFRKADSYTAVFNGSGLASGVYFYRITAIGKTETYINTNKMILVK